MMSRMMSVGVGVAVLLSVVGQAVANDLRTSVRLSYRQQIADVVSWYDDNVGDASGVPVALSVALADELDNGLLIWGDFGPGMLVYNATTDDMEIWSVPLSVGIGYSFAHKANVSPYVKLGIRYAFSGGDQVESSTPGVVGLVGLEILKQKTVGIVIEAGYDTSSITLSEDGGIGSHEEDIDGGFVVSLGAVF